MLVLPRHILVSGQMPYQCTGVFHISDTYMIDENPQHIEGTDKGIVYLPVNFSVKTPFTLYSRKEDTDVIYFMTNCIESALNPIFNIISCRNLLSLLSYALFISDLISCISVFLLFYSANHVSITLSHMQPRYCLIWSTASIDW